MVIYEEKIPTYPVITLMVGMSCLVFALFIIAPFFGKLLVFTPIIRMIIAVVLLLDIIAFISFTKLKIAVTEDTLQFGFGKFGKKFPITRIISIEPSKYSFTNYYGYGVRMGLDNSIGYAPRGGAGVLVKIKDDKRPYFVSTANPEKLISAIKQRMR